MYLSYTDFVMAVLFGVGAALSSADMMKVRAAYEAGRSVRAAVADILAANVT